MTEDEARKILDFKWEPLMLPSWLCLKQYGPKKAIVVRMHPDIYLGSNIARMYQGWLNGVKIYDPEDEFKVGQVISL